MPTDHYLGIVQSYTSLIKSGGSRFLGFLMPVRDWAHAQELLQDLRMRYADATHVCYGCVLGVDREEQRFSDDGEPSNSAGRPILNGMLSSGASFFLAVVVRYYGGKKLGIPGLIAAYGGATSACLEQAEFREIPLLEQLRCSIDPALSYQLYNYLQRHKDLQYSADEGEFVLQVPKSLTASLREDLSKIPTLVFPK